MIKRIFFLIAVSFLFVNCDPSSGTTEINCDKTETIGIKNATGTETGTVNQEIKITVSFEVENSCGTFVSFKEMEGSTAKTKILAVEAKYDSCFCEYKPFLRIADYKFTPTEAGTYTFKFKVTGTTFKTITVVVS